MSWLDLLIEETDFVETPKVWLYWSGLATISAIAGPNIVAEKGAYKLKPNLFILLMGRSGLGKGFGPSVANKLVRMVGNTRVISGRATIEGIVKELSLVKAKSDGSIPYKDARGFICNGEFAASLYESTSALTVLTDLYDGHYNADYKNTLKNSAGEELNGLCVTLLSGANPEMFDLAVSKHHKTGGFVGRTSLIHADKRFRSNSMIYAEDEIAPQVDYDRLAEHLVKLAKLKGTMVWSRHSKEVYDRWFYPYRELAVEDKTGTYDRLNDHAIKIMTCISLARKLDMRIDVEDVEEGISIISPLSNTAMKAAGMGDKSSIALTMKPFLVIMFSAPEYKLTRKQVLQKGFGDFDSSELDRIIDTLHQSGFVKQSNKNGEIMYQITKVGIEWWERNTGKK